MWRIATRYCEYCHRPDVGSDRCPHAIDSRYDCPHRSGKHGRQAERHGNNPFMGNSYEKKEAL